MLCYARCARVAKFSLTITRRKYEKEGAMRPLAKRAIGLSISAIRAMSERAKKKPGIIDLTLGMGGHDVPEEIKDAVHAAIESPRSGSYSPNAGFPKVREAVAQKLRTRNGIDAKPDEVIITNGVTGGLFLVLATLLDPGDEVIVFDPYFVLYPRIIRFLGARMILIPTYPDWRIPFSELTKHVTRRTKAIILNTPNNPTGCVYHLLDCDRLARFAKKHGLWIIADEVYEDFVYQGRHHVSIGSIYPNTFTVMGPGKSLSIPGWRAGYLHAPPQAIAEALKVQHVAYTCSPTLAQAALTKALTFDMSTIRAAHAAKRDYVRVILGDLSGIEGAFYAFVPAPPGKTGTSFTEELFEKGVAVVPGLGFSKEDTHIRIAYANLEEEELIRALTIIRDARVHAS